jgi:hypothetical protein
MADDYAKEKEEFLAELKAGKYDIEYLPNSSLDYEELDKEDMDAFNTHLESGDFKSLIDEALK